jgi:hypothetical protein
MTAFARARLVLLATAVFVVFGVPGSSPATPPPLDLTYHPNGSLTVNLGDGSAVSGSVTIPPGPYWVTISNEFFAEHDTVHKWHLFGPGVDVVTDLNNGDNKVEQYLETLLPSSTYTAQDDYRPSLQVVFRTSATGSSIASPSAGSSSPGSSKAKTGSIENAPTVGSARLPYRGELAATVSAAGRLSLTRGGKRVGGVASLKAGRYSIVVVDRSKTAGLTLQRLHFTGTTIAGGSFTGKRTVELTLRVGTWLFFFGRGPTTRFSVVR